MDPRTLVEAHRLQAERLGPAAAVRSRRDGAYHDLSWADYRAGALACAAALADAGVRPGDRVAVLGGNCAEWLVADMGGLTAGAVQVPLHTPLSARQVHFQLCDAGVRWLFVSDAAQLDKARQVRGELPGLEGVVVFDPACAGADAVAWDAFLDRGRRALARAGPELARREAALTPDDLATVMYTSGTTGNPKGVMLTHGNLVSNAFANLGAAPTDPADLVLCWLPLSHIYARTVDHYKCLVAGLTLCLAESIETVTEHLARVQPMHVSCVPRFYEKVLAAVGTADPAETGRRLRGVFGPRIKTLGSGGAALPVPTERVLRAAGLPLIPGYGLTESSPTITFNRTDRFKVGSVGLPVPGVEVKVAADGEVLCRGPNVMKGYWNNPGATAEAVRDGWLYTGDLGEVDADGFLFITGRKKDLIVLSNGKKVVPAQVEGLILGDGCFDQAAVYGEGRHFLTALLVPHWPNLRAALRAAGTPLDGEPDDALARHPAVEALLRARLYRALADVAGFEHVRKFLVLPRPFSVAAEELTVSLKLRRNVVFDRYREELDGLYRGECG
jgi:long-chain acyl-CoA synthetase